VLTSAARQFLRDDEFFLHHSEKIPRGIGFYLPMDKFSAPRTSGVRIAYRWRAPRAGREKL